MDEEYPYSLKIDQIKEIILKFSNPETGIKIGFQTFKKKSTKKGFIGEEGVSYLLKNKMIEMESLTRRHCIEFLQLLLSMGVIIDSFDKESLTYEGNNVYEFIKGFNRNELTEYISNFLELKKLRLLVLDLEEMKKFYNSFVQEVEIKDRVSLYTFKKCFIGSEAVSWISKKYHVSRHTATHLGEKLRIAGAFDHVVQKHCFVDGPYFYKMRSLEDFTSKRPLSAIEFIMKEFNQILITPLSELPVSKDLFRMFKQFKFYKQDIEMKYFKENDQEIDILMNLMNFILKLINDKELNEEIFKKEVNLNDYNSLTFYLIKYYGEDHKMIKLLKLCHQGIVIGFLGRLGEKLFYNYGLRFKDIKGSWYIHIIERNGIDYNSYFTIRHVRKEQAISIKNNSDIKNLFSFQWALEIEFNSLMNSIQNVHSKMIEIDWKYSKEILEKDIMQSHENKFHKLFDIEHKQNIIHSLPTSPVLENENDHHLSVSGFLSHLMNIQKNEMNPEFIENFIQISLEFISSLENKKIKIISIKGLNENIIKELSIFYHLMEIDFNKNDPLHSKLLKNLQNILLKYDYNDPIETNGTGILGILILYGFSSKYPFISKSLLEKKHIPYSFIILSFLIFILNQIQSGFLNDYFISDIPIKILEKILLFVSLLVNDFITSWKKLNPNHYTNHLVKIEEKFIKKHKKMIQKFKVLYQSP